MHQENTKLHSIKVPKHGNRWKNALFTVNYVNNRFFLLQTKIFHNSSDRQKILFGQNKKIHDMILNDKPN
jgi:hypothetical protein